MSFDTAWLDLREPADNDARNPDLVKTFVEALPPAPRIIDLGSGTGSTLRALSDAVPTARWRLTDHDPALLDEACRRHPDAQAEQIDLAKDLECALAFEADVITASALIDLVSAEWLDRLAERANGRILYIALSYDGEEDWTPAHFDDAEVFTAFQKHQRGNKGFGPALGPAAAPYLADVLTRAGYSVRIAPSPWVLQSGPLMHALAEGISSAASEVGVETDVVQQWYGARREAESCIVGHLDLLAVPE